MQQPSGEKSNQCSYGHRSKGSHLPKREMHRVEEKLHHEVLPVDIDPTPEISETSGQKVEMVRFGEIKAEHVQQTYDQVKIP